MKKIPILLLFSLNILFSKDAVANTQNWTPHNSPFGGITVYLPFVPSVYDSLRTVVMTAESDSTIGFNVHYVDTVKFLTGLQFFDTLITKYSGDSVRAFADAILSIANADLVSVQNITAPNDSTILGLEIGMEIPHPTYETLITFCRIYRKGNKLAVITISAGEFEAATLYNYKTFYFANATLNW